MRKLIVLALALCPLVSAQWTQVQSPVQVSATYTQSITLTVTASRSGSALGLVTACLGQGTPYTGFSVSDNRSNSWTQAIVNKDSGDQLVSGAFFALTPAAGVTSVTVTATGGLGGCAAFWAGFEERTPPTGVLALDVVNKVVVSVAGTQTVATHVTTTGNDWIIAGGWLPSVTAVASPFALDLSSVDSGTGRAQGLASYASASPVLATSTFTVAPSDGYSSDAVVVIAAIGTGTSGGGSGGDIALSGCGMDTVGAKATIGSPCQITSSLSGVNFALSGGGTISCTTNCTSTTFTPPATITTHARQGCAVQPADSIFNTRVDNLPVHPNSGTWTSGGFATLTLQILPAWGLDIVTNSSATTRHQFHYTTTLNGVPFFYAPQWQSTREGGPYNFDTQNDHHSVSLNRQTCTYYELYNDGVFAEHTFGPNMDAASAYIFNGNTYDLPTDLGGATDAAGLPLTAVVLHASDVRNGGHHTMRMTLCTGCISAQAHYWPAQQANGDSTLTQAQAPSNGSIYRLKSSYNCGVFSPMAQNICNQLKQYGVMVADNGTSGQIIGDADLLDDPAAAAAINEFSFTNVSLANMEVVDLLDTAHAGAGSLMINPVSSQINPANPYVNPPYFSVITATKSAAVTSVPIAVQPVAVGTPYPYLYAEAGTVQSGYQIQTWVNGSANQSITWVRTSGTGTITSGGLYRPPASTGSTETDILTGTSVADSTATVQVVVTVFPQGANPANTIRLDIAGNGCTTPTCSQVWVADPRPGSGTDWCCGGTTTGWAATPDVTVWASDYHNVEILGRFLLENGNYQVTIQDAKQGDGGATLGTYDPNYVFGLNVDRGGPNVLMANDVLGGYVDFGLLTPNSYYVHEYDQYTIPAKVTNNVLMVRDNDFAYSYGQVHVPSVSGLIIQPDSTTTPHWSIDSAQQSLLTPGALGYWNCMVPITATTGLEPRIAGTIQLRVVDTYTGFQDPNWTIISGPGSVNASGCYTPPNSVTATTPVLVQACSQSSSLLCGTKTLWVKGPVSQAAIHQ